MASGGAARIELDGVFRRKLPLAVMVVLGQWDPTFESGRAAGMELYARARLAAHEEGHRIPQEEDWGELVRRFLRGEEQ